MKLQYLIYCMCLIFMASWAVNYWYSRFFLALPFTIIALILSKKLGILFFTIAVSIVMVLVNLTLEYNPYVFPILKWWWVVFLKDSYAQYYGSKQTGIVEITSISSWSMENHFWEKLENQTMIKDLLVKKWTSARVNWIVVQRWMIDSDTSITLLTEYWPITETNYKDTGSWSQNIVVLNSVVLNPFFDTLSQLMNYPAILIAPFTYLF